jgi:hypothetical protein
MRRSWRGARRCPRRRERGEHPVTPHVQPFYRLGEVPVGQARIQPPGEADDLLRRVTLQRGRGVHVVARLDPAGQGAHLAADDVLEVENGTELHDHRAAGAVEVGHLQHHLLPARGGDDPLGHAFAQAVEDVAESAGLVAALGSEPSLAQRGLDRVRGGLHTALFVAEDIDVLRKPVDDPVSDQGVAAA